MILRRMLPGRAPFLALCAIILANLHLCPVSVEGTPGTVFFNQGGKGYKFTIPERGPPLSQAVSASSPVEAFIKASTPKRKPEILVLNADSHEDQPSDSVISESKVRGRKTKVTRDLEDENDSATLSLDTPTSLREEEENTAFTSAEKKAKKAKLLKKRPRRLPLCRNLRWPYVTAAKSTPCISDEELRERDIELSDFGGERFGRDGYDDYDAPRLLPRPISPAAGLRPPRPRFLVPPPSRGFEEGYIQNRPPPYNYGPGRHSPPEHGGAWTSKPTYGGHGQGLPPPGYPPVQDNRINGPPPPGHGHQGQGQPQPPNQGYPPQATPQQPQAPKIYQRPVIPQQQPNTQPAPPLALQQQPQPARSGSRALSFGPQQLQQLNGPSSSPDYNRELDRYRKVVAELLRRLNNQNNVNSLNISPSPQPQLLPRPISPLNVQNSQQGNSVPPQSFQFNQGQFSGNFRNTQDQSQSGYVQPPSDVTNNGYPQGGSNFGPPPPQYTSQPNYGQPQNSDSGYGKPTGPNDDQPQPGPNYDPPTSSGSYGPPPGSDSGYGPPSQQPGSNYDKPSTSDANYGQPAPPPPAQGGYGPPPGSDSGYGPPPGSDLGYEPPPGSNSGPPSTSDSNYGSSPNYPPSSGYGAPSQSDSNYGHPPSNPSSSSYGPPPQSDSNIGPPPPGSNYGSPPSTSNYGPPAQSDSNYGPPPSSSNYGPPPQSDSGYGPPPTSQSDNFEGIGPNPSQNQPQVVSYPILRPQGGNSYSKPPPPPPVNSNFRQGKYIDLSAPNQQQFPSSALNQNGYEFSPPPTSSFASGYGQPEIYGPPSPPPSYRYGPQYNGPPPQSRYLYPSREEGGPGGSASIQEPGGGWGQPDRNYQTPHGLLPPQDRDIRFQHESTTVIAPIPPSQNQESDVNQWTFNPTPTPTPQPQPQQLQLSGTTTPTPTITATPNPQQLPLVGIGQLDNSNFNKLNPTLQTSSVKIGQTNQSIGNGEYDPVIEDIFRTMNLDELETSLGLNTNNKANTDNSKVTNVNSNTPASNPPQENLTKPQQPQKRLAEVSSVGVPVPSPSLTPPAVS